MKKRKRKWKWKKRKSCREISDLAVVVSVAAASEVEVVVCAQQEVQATSVESKTAGPDSVFLPHPLPLLLRLSLHLLQQVWLL